ncbi:acylphosphatase [Vibrio sp. PP-XX7]
MKYSLSGWVNNDAGGVNIDVQGRTTQLALFREVIMNHPPALARVDSVDCVTSTLVERDGFDIRYSQEDRDISVCVTPDQSICADCLADLNDPQSRYFGYPFTNCTHCGPRYTIVKQLPYDRCHTSMQQFELCPDCQASYQNPLDRRYHAQPISCSSMRPFCPFVEFVCNRNCHQR